MTPTPTVERVAIAICESLGLEWDAQASGMTSASGSDEEQEGFRLMARAAIEAMRDVGDIPITKIYALIDKICPENEIGPDEVAAIWHAMLDAALGRGGV